MMSVDGNLPVRQVQPAARAIARVSIGVAVPLISIGQIACYLPASGASKLDPTETLRAE